MTTITFDRLETWANATPERVRWLLAHIGTTDSDELIAADELTFYFDEITLEVEAMLRTHGLVCDINNRALTFDVSKFPNIRRLLDAGDSIEEMIIVYLDILERAAEDLA